MKCTVTFICFIPCAASAAVHKIGSNENSTSTHLFGIQGGKIIPIEKRPYTASLTNSDHNLLGIAVIIDKKWILTTAYNVYDMVPEELLIKVAADNINTGGLLVNVDRIFIHPNYNGSLVNNLALLKLPYSVRLSNKTQPIALGDSLPRAGQKTIVTGYGSTTFSYQFDGYLREAELPFIPYNKCKSHYTFKEPTFTSQNFCASKKGVGARPWDWGAPLVFKDKLIGIFLKSDKDCGNTQYPGIYIDLTQFRKWINETITP